MSVAPQAVRGAEVSGHGLDIGVVSEDGTAQSGSSCADLLQRWTQASMARGHRVHGLTLERGAATPSGAARQVGREGIDWRLVSAPARSNASPHANDTALVDAALAWLAETPCDIVHVFGAGELAQALLRAGEETGLPLACTAAGTPAQALDLAPACRLEAADPAAASDAGAWLEARYAAIIVARTGRAPQALSGRGATGAGSGAPASAPKRAGFFQRWFGRGD